MKGSYILLIYVEKDSKIKVGRLGEILFKKGYYCYVGSGMGKGKSLEKRVERHLRKRKKRKWHIDYLLSKPWVKVEAIFLFPSERRLECEISKRLRKFAGGFVKNFGCSDCKCESHLYYLKKRREFILLLRHLDIEEYSNSESTS